MYNSHNIKQLLMAIFLRSITLLIACSFLLHTASASEPSAPKLVNKQLEYGAFYGAKDQTKHINLASVRNMDNHQLFISADHLRNKKMSAQQRVFNYYWLHQSSSNTLTGSKALSRFLRLGFTAYWSQSSEPWNTEGAPLLIFETQSLNTLWGECKLKASKNRIALKYQMAF